MKIIIMERKRKGELKHSVEVEVPAREAWELYGTLRLAKLVEEKLSSVVSSVTVDGDGGEGTLVKVTLAGNEAAGFTEKFTKVDGVDRVKETEVVEGGHLEMGFSLYRVRFHITEKSAESCLISSSVVYELSPDASSDAASLASIDNIAAIALLAKDHLTHH